MSCALFSCTRQNFRAHRIIIPALPSPTSQSSSSSSSSQADASSSEYRAHCIPNPQLLSFLNPAAAHDFRRQDQLRHARTAAAHTLEQVWLHGKPHLRAQQKLIDQLGVDGAVRETLQPTKVSFHEQLRQRPLDRAILEEIYRGLHGRRVERALKKGVSWEHWITKGEGTSPVYNTSAKTQQTFAFGGHIELLCTATHPQEFPPVLRSAQSMNRVKNSSARRWNRGDTNRAQHINNRGACADKYSGITSANRESTSADNDSSCNRRLSEFNTAAERARSLPEVAFIGRTSSGKSSLINALVNAMITPYGHLQGTTDSVRFYSVAQRLIIVDCPGYGHVNRLHTPILDAECAQRAMRAYLRLARRNEHYYAQQKHEGKRSAKRTRAASGTPNDLAMHNPVPSEATADMEDEDEKGSIAEDVISTKSENEGSEEMHERVPLARFPLRNVKRVFVCVSSRGMQHSDFAYCDLLEHYQIPFAVVLTKTDSAPIRFLARLTDYTRSRLVRYNYCKELMLTSALRLAGIDKMQDLVASFALGDDAMNGATMNFDSIV